MTTYYIDESGHSGDLVTGTGRNFDFEGQPFFTLAAVGVADISKLEEAVALLRVEHRVPPGELKSKSLQSKSAFITDLLNLLIMEKCQLFVETVNKRYFVCIQIVNIILVQSGVDFGSPEKTWRWQNMAADWLYENITEHVLSRFVDACRTPSDHTLMSALGSLLLITARTRQKWSDEFYCLMRELVEETIRAYGQMREQNTKAFLEFLPIPDQSKRAREVWILPNLSSLTNIYARINRYHERRLADVNLMHDHQLQLDDILSSALHSAEVVGDYAITPYADYRFLESASLQFCGSKENLGIQCADVLAGTVMRYFRDILYGQAVDGGIEIIMRKLLEGTDLLDGFGINQVVPSNMVFLSSPHSPEKRTFD